MRSLFAPALLLCSPPRASRSCLGSAHCSAVEGALPHAPGTHGSHILLDFVGFDHDDAHRTGEWVLKTINNAVDDHGVRRVHSKLVILGQNGESPPGFTAVTLLDESHVTAHCYSERGWLAIDVFTCGAHDPCPLARDIRDSVLAYSPGATCVNNRRVGRFHMQDGPVAQPRLQTHCF